MGTTSLRSDPTTQLAPVLLPVDYVARLLSVSPRHLRNLARRNQLRIVHVGRRTLVPRSEIDRLAGGGGL